MMPPGTFSIALDGRMRLGGIGAASNDAGDCEAGYTLDIGIVESAAIPLVCAPPPLHPAKIVAANADESTRQDATEMRSTPRAMQELGPP
jgi:hypothetical protein